MITNNICTIREKIHKVAIRCGRAPESIKLIAVSKRFPTSAITEAATCGQTLFGENYIQEAAQKFEDLDDTIQFHFIGHLQSNKAKVAASIFHMIETVDNQKLARALNRHAESLHKKLKILVQVNIGKDPKKSGVMPEDAEPLIESIADLSNIKLCGLMTMPPWESTPEKSRLYFQKLRVLSEKLASKELFHDSSSVELSMGMSSDYAIAIEEGATLIRIGTAIFGQRKNLSK